MPHQIFKHKFLIFLFTGGFAAFVNFFSRIISESYVSFEIAIVCAHLFAMVTAYCLASLFVFRPSGRSKTAEFSRFAVVNLFSLILVWCSSVGLANVIFPKIGFTWYSNDIAHMIGIMITAVSSYLGHKYFTFAKAKISQ